MKIVVRDTSSSLRIIASGRYATEQQLQEFLLNSPDLIPLDEVDPSAMPLLTIGSEVAVAAGKIDALYLDAAGLLTVVETKLKRNPESRREVIGQIIEYAANLSEWTADEVIRQAEAFLALKSKPTSSTRLQDAMNNLLRETVGERESAVTLEELKNGIAEQLANGRMRLIIAVDDISEQLRRSVTFLNTFSHFELYLLQLVHFEDDKNHYDVFVPSLFGYVRRTEARNGPILRWDEERFFEALHELPDKAKIETVTWLYQYANDIADEVRWGAGKEEGSFSFYFNHDEKQISVFTVSTKGRLWINFGGMKDKVSPQKLEALRLDLNSIPNVRLPPKGIEHKWPSIRLDLLSDENQIAAFTDAVQRFRESMKGP